MQKGCWMVLAAAGIGVLAGRPAGSQGVSPHSVFRAGHILVGFKRSVSAGVAHRVLAATRGVNGGELPQVGAYLVHLSSGGQDSAVLDYLRHQPEVAYAEVDQLVPPSAVPNDPLYASQWHLPNISAPDAWNTSTGSNAVTIAILDTGVEATHPDLAAKLVSGWNFYDGNDKTADTFGHGTMVAGTAAAQGNNKIGSAGVSWGARIMPCRVSDANGYASLSAISAALTWAADHGARVANISYAVSNSSAVSSAAQYFQSKGGVVTVAAGNAATFDATADNSNLINVSATDETNTLASWSNSGNNVDLCAPGDNITTTETGGTYGSYSGTSFSAPVVAGVAALVLSINPNLTGAQLRDLLLKSVDDLGTAGWDAKYGWGRINARKAVIAALGPDTTAPTVAITSPATGTVVSGKVSVQVTASDVVGVTSVALSVDGKPSLTALSAAPYTFTWDSSSAAAGNHTLQATALDAAGNKGSSTVVTVSIKDTAAPTVSITSPTSGTTVSGKVAVQVTAADNVGVASVALTVDGSTSVGTLKSAPYAFTWDSSSAAAGNHTLQATALDAAGNKTSSTAVTVSIKDTTPPTVSITSPSGGAAVSGKVAVQVAASDNVGVSSVSLTVDGSASVGTLKTAPYAFTWDSSTAAPGSHTLQATALDAAGNKASSTVVTITVKDTTAPTVAITSPATGTSVSGAVAVQVSAGDNVGVASVSLLVDGKASGSAVTAAPYVFSWDSGTAAGTHTLQAVATDAAGNKTTSATVTVTITVSVAKDGVAPTATLTAIGSGSAIAVQITATDNVGVTRVELWLDGKLNAQANAASLSLSLDSTTWSNGTHTLQAKAYDAAGNVGVTASISLNKSAKSGGITQK